MMEDSLHEASREDARRSQRMEEHMATVFGTTWHDLPPGPPVEEGNQDSELGWWSIDPRGRARRPRMVRLVLNGKKRNVTDLHYAGYSYFVSLYAQS